MAPDRTHSYAVEREIPASRANSTTVTVRFSKCSFTVAPWVGRVVGLVPLRTFMTSTLNGHGCRTGCRIGCRGRTFWLPRTRNLVSELLLVAALVAGALRTEGLGCLEVSKQRRPRWRGRIGRLGPSGGRRVAVDCPFPSPTVADRTGPHGNGIGRSGVERTERRRSNHPLASHAHTYFGGGPRPPPNVSALSCGVAATYLASKMLVPMHVASVAPEVVRMR